jgi:hypothetical protein
MINALKRSNISNRDHVGYTSSHCRTNPARLNTICKADNSPRNKTYQDNNNRNGGPNLSEIQCFICKDYGHYGKYCPNVNRKQNGYAGNGDSNKKRNPKSKDKNKKPSLNITSIE